MSQFELKDCPFCGRDNRGVGPNLIVKYVGEPYDDCILNVFRVVCICGASTKYANNPQLAADIWNKRAGDDKEA